MLCREWCARSRNIGVDKIERDIAGLPRGGGRCRRCDCRRRCDTLRRECALSAAVDRNCSTHPRRRCFQGTRLLERFQIGRRGDVLARSEEHRYHGERSQPAHCCTLPRGGRNGGDAGRPGGTPSLGGKLIPGAGWRAAVFATGGCGGGCCTRFGSSFGSRVLVPPGPLRDTSRGVMLSIRQPLTASPSVTLSGLAPLTAKIAT